MTATLIDGKKKSLNVRAELKEKIAQLSKNPVLAVIIVGNNPASEIYVRNKEKACADVGIIAQTYHLPDSVSHKELTSLIKDLNNKTEINGILVQLPLPKHLNENEILAVIDPKKDVDGFHPVNIGLMSLKSPQAFIPCTPKGILSLIKDIKDNLDGMTAVVIGRSQIVGLPMARLLLAQNCTVTVAHSRTKDLPALCRTADILIVAIGKAEMITKEYIKPGAIVIDVGINRTEDGLKGDVKQADALEVAAHLTPVPGGVGPMTITMLLENTYNAFLLQNRS